MKRLGAELSSKKNPGAITLLGGLRCRVGNPSESDHYVYSHGDLLNKTTSYISNSCETIFHRTIFCGILWNGLRIVATSDLSTAASGHVDHPCTC